MIINGKELARGIIEGLGQRPVPKRFFAAFLAGDDPASASFVRQKEKVAKVLGIDFRTYRFPADITNDALRKKVLQIVGKKRCGGALVQLPLPAHLNRHYILNVVPREKDVDVLGERALGAFYTGRNPVVPPAVGTVQHILKAIRYTLEAREIAVVGLGLLVGKPIAHWLMGKTKELYLLDSSSDLSILKDADLVISGVGKAGLITPEMLKAGAGVIDFGYDEHGEGMTGDLDASSLNANEAISSKLMFYTPTPGGTGPILVAQLMENFYALNEAR